MKPHLLVTLALLPACTPAITPDPPHDAPDSASVSDSAPVSVPDSVPDSDSVPASFHSDPLGLSWIDASPSTSRGLVLLSARFTEDEAGAGFHQECLAEVRNDGGATLCAITARVSLQDGDDMERAGFSAAIDAPPFDVGLGRSAPCLAPGQHGAFFATAEVDEPVGPDTVRGVVVTFSSEPVALATPHARAPTIDWMSAEHLASKYYRLVGIASAHGAVHDVVLHAYPIVGGVLRKQLVATHPSTLPDGASWSFATGRADAPFTDILGLFAFVEGPG